MIYTCETTPSTGPARSRSPRDSVKRYPHMYFGDFAPLGKGFGGTGCDTQPLWTFDVTARTRASASAWRAGQCHRRRGLTASSRFQLVAEGAHSGSPSMEAVLAAAADNGIELLGPVPGN
jgi:hypothetical protein